MCLHDATIYKSIKHHLILTFFSFPVSYHYAFKTPDIAIVETDGSARKNMRGVCIHMYY